MEPAAVQSDLADRAGETSAKTSSPPKGYGVPVAMPQNISFLSDGWAGAMMLASEFRPLLEETEMLASEFVSLLEETGARAGEFVSLLEEDEESEEIPALEHLPAFMVSVGITSSKSSVPLPYIFEGGHGRVCFTWLREGKGDCYLYAKLDSMKAKWVESDNGEHIRTEILDVSCGSEDWASLARYLRAAYAK